MSPGGGSLFAYTATTVTLQPGHSYRLNFRLGFWNGDTNVAANFTCQFFNQTSSTYFGPQVNSIVHAYSRTSGDLVGYITPTVPTTISIRVREYMAGSGTITVGQPSGNDAGPLLSVETLN